MQVRKTGKTIGMCSKIKALDILKQICFGDGFGICFGVILATSWRQVGPKGGFGGYESRKKHERKVTQLKLTMGDGGGFPLIQQYKQPDSRWLTTDDRLTDSRHFRP